MKLRAIPGSLAACAAASVAVTAAAAPVAAQPSVSPVLAPSPFARAAAWVEALFHAEGGGNAIGHLVAAGLLFVMAVLLRRPISHVIFAWLRRLAARTTTTLDDELSRTLETPVGWLVFVLLTYAALRVLVLPAW